MIWLILGLIGFTAFLFVALALVGIAADAAQRTTRISRNGRPPRR